MLADSAPDISERLVRQKFPVFSEKEAVSGLPDVFHNSRVAAGTFQDVLREVRHELPVLLRIWPLGQMNVFWDIGLDHVLARPQVDV